MSVVFMDGFDLYTGATTAVGINTRWTLGGTGGQVSLQTGRFGGQSVRFTASNSLAHATSPAFTGVSSFSFGCSLKTELDPDRCLAFSNGSTHHVCLSYNADGSITAYRSSTALGSSAAGVLTSGAWVTLEVECVIDDSAGSVKVYVDGAQVINLTGQDTRNGATSTVTNIRLGYISATVAETHYDDLYITDSATKPTAALRIETVSPDADGGTLNWTPSTGSDHFAVVDEQPGSRTDYLSASVAGDTDELEVGALSDTPTGIEAVQAVALMEKTDATARTAQIDIGSGGSTGAGTAATLATTGTFVGNLLNTDPATAAAWTKSGVEASKVLPKVAS